MMLGGYPLPWDPDKWTIPDAEQVISEQDTWSSNVIFFYGAKLVGKTIVLEWDWMSQEQFDALDVLYQADLPVAWVLQEPSDPRAFVVEISALDGALFEVALWDQPRRKDVKMSLIILQAPDLVMS